MNQRAEEPTRTVLNCPQCGAEFSTVSPDHPCPACLIRLGLPEASSIEPGDKELVAQSPPSAEDLHAIFPNLEVLDLLGQGGMGAVYRARQASLDRFVALKVIRAEVAGREGFAERFAREAKALAKLNHSNIVTVHDFGDVDGLYYLVMEYVEGSNLQCLIESGNLEPNQALQIVSDVCQAMQVAHDAGVIHRDIKPANILINSAGKVKIADFGLARLIGEDKEQHQLTETHQVMGTPRYMAPEQMMGARQVDHRADIYSLGVVFYEMLTGEVPLGHFSPPSQRVDVDARLDEVVLRSLAQEPEKRFQQAGEIKTEVESISGRHNQQVAISTPSSVEGAVPRRRPLRIHPAVVASVTLGTLVLTTVILWYAIYGKPDLTLAHQLTNAVTEGDLPRVRVLLEKGANPNEEDSLAWAAGAGEVAVIRELIAAGADVDQRVDHGVTPLMVAAGTGRAKAVRCLLESGAEIDAQDHGQLVDIWVFASEDSERGFEYSSPGSELTALMIAAAAGEIDVVKILLDAGADPDTRAESRKTALIFALQNQDLECAGLLIKAGADLDLPDRSGRTARSIAEGHSRKEVKEWFAEVTSGAVPSN